TPARSAITAVMSIWPWWRPGCTASGATATTTTTACSIPWSQHSSCHAWQMRANALRWPTSCPRTRTCSHWRLVGACYGCSASLELGGSRVFSPCADVVGWPGSSAGSRGRRSRTNVSWLSLAAASGIHRRSRTPSRRRSALSPPGMLSLRATRTILGRLEQVFGGRLPTPAEMLAADSRSCSRERHVNAQGGNLAGGGATLRRWPAERQCVVSHLGRGRRGRADQHSGDRTVDGARLPARRARPTRRVPDGRRRAPAGIGERLRLRPSPDGRRDAPAGRTLATVSKPRGQLPVRLRIRRTHTCPSLS